MKRALIVVDLQNEYLPTGKLPLTGIEDAARQARRAMDHAREAGIAVIHIRHESGSADAPLFVKNSSGAEIQAQATPVGDEPVVIKHHINAFRDTDLKQQLEASGAQELVVVGAMSHMCIDAVVRAAVDMGYPVTVLHDACATLDLTFNGVTAPAAHVHAAMMAALEFGYAKVESVDHYLSA